MSEVLIGEKQQHQDSTQGNLAPKSGFVFWKVLSLLCGCRYFIVRGKKYSESLGKELQHIHNLSFRHTKEVTDEIWGLTVEEWRLAYNQSTSLSAQEEVYFYYQMIEGSP